MVESMETATIKKSLGTKGRIDIGLTHIKSRGNLVFIEHHGNMGNSIKTINENLARVDFPTIESIKETFEIVEEYGYPDYIYSLKFKI